MGPTGKSFSRSYAGTLDMLIPEDAPIDMDSATAAKSKAAERYMTAMKYLTQTVPNSSKTIVDVYVQKQQVWSNTLKDRDWAKQSCTRYVIFITCSSCKGLRYSRWGRANAPAKHWGPTASLWRQEPSQLRNVCPFEPEVRLWLLSISSTKAALKQSIWTVSQAFLPKLKPFWLNYRECQEK